MYADPPQPASAFDQRVFGRAVSAYAADHELFPAGARALVMVSGGQDSVTLLHLLATGALGRRGPREVRALHVNHGLRGSASESDQALVEGLCDRLGIPLVVRRGPVDKLVGNLQERARDVRRSTAAEVAAAIGAHCVALGHTLDDQAETILYRLGRYAGVAALAGMRPRDGVVVRPLLGRRRWETEEYCEGLGLAFASDLGNDDPAYVRTRIRREVVPPWERSLPGAVEALGRAAESAAEATDLMAAIEGAVACFVGAGAAGVPGANREPRQPGRPTDWPAELSVARLREVPCPLRRAFLHGWLSGLDRGSPTRARVLAIDALIQKPGSGEIALGGGRWVRKEYDRLCAVAWTPDWVGSVAAEARTAAGQPPAATLTIPGSVVWEGLRLTADMPGRLRAHDPRSEVYLDARGLSDALCVRGPRPGDRVRPLGAPGHRALQDVLVDRRVPARLRHRVPLVVDGDRVVWVVGLTVGEGSRIGPDTERVVRLAVTRLDEECGSTADRTEDRGAYEDPHTGG